MSIVLNAQGTPEPPTEIVTRLRRVHPSLGLRFAGMPNRPWQIIWSWPATDPRWTRVQQHEIGEESAYDIIGSLPVGCGVDEAAAYVERSFKDYPIENIRNLRERMHHYNTVEMPAAQVEDALIGTMEGFASDKRQKNPRRTKVTPTAT